MVKILYGNFGRRHRINTLISLNTSEKRFGYWRATRSMRLFWVGPLFIMIGGGKGA
jgi:hypothetical protein